MNMSQISTEFSREDIQNLSGLIGSQYLFVGGKDVPEYLMASQFIISTTYGSLIFEGDVVEADFEGYLENYSRIDIRKASVKDISSLESRGQVFRRHSGSNILDVLVVRQVITEFFHGQPTWSLATSRAIILDLGQTQLCLSKLGQHDEALAITEQHGFDIEKLPSTSNYFEPNLETEYRFEQKLISLGSANG